LCCALAFGWGFVVLEGRVMSELSESESSQLVVCQDAQSVTPTLTHSFESLLTDDIDAALELRLEGIEAAAHSHRADAEAAKISLATLTAMGAVLSSSPLVAVVGDWGLWGIAGWWSGISRRPSDSDRFPRLIRR
jgi:hypothetical protein